MSHLFTVGHSNHSIEYFMELLAAWKIEVVADVRQYPYSRYVAHFNREEIEKVLLKSAIKYVFMGDQLGARPSEAAYYTNSKVDFSRLAEAPFFKEGIKRLAKGMQQHRIALMCSEKDPIVCHRTVLVCRNLCQGRSDINDIEIMHIRENGELEEHKDLEARLLQLHKLDHPDIFMSRHQRLQEAYDRQGNRIAAAGDQNVYSL